MTDLEMNKYAAFWATVAVVSVVSLLAFGLSHPKVGVLMLVVFICGIVLGGLWLVVYVTIDDSQERKKIEKHLKDLPG